MVVARKKMEMETGLGKKMEWFGKEISGDGDWFGKESSGLGKKMETSFCYS